MTQDLTPRLMYHAVKNNLDEYDGIFYLGVTSTNIFCIPSCKARTPKFENCKFFLSKNQAINAGFRGCKRCRSEFYPNNEPEWYRPLISMLNNIVDRKILIDEIEKITNTSYSTVYRYFKNYLNISPAFYHRKIRLRKAHELIKSGKDYRDIIYGCGFESLSGFRSAYYLEYGYNPGEIL